MNSRCAALLARDRSRWPLAGDQLYVDLDLSHENLPTGQRLAIGEAVIQITEIAHTGCADFAARYGAAALRFVNSQAGKRLRLRGVYARIIQDGLIRVGDRVVKL
jgi:MOSC domain-containing protein YiiM